MKETLAWAPVPPHRLDSRGARRSPWEAPGRACLWCLTPAHARGARVREARSAQRAASGTSTVPNHTLDVDSSSPQQSSMLLWRIISIALRSAADGSLHHVERVQKGTRRSTQTHSARAASSSPCLDRRSPGRSRSGVPPPRALAPHSACTSSQGSSRPEVNLVFLLLFEICSRRRPQRRTLTGFQGHRGPQREGAGHAQHALDHR